jgi:hypothetical protein
MQAALAGIRCVQHAQVIRMQPLYFMAWSIKVSSTGRLVLALL